MIEKYPIKMIPYCADYIWGGVKLKEKWGKISSSATLAETWELSAYEGKNSFAANGPLNGKSLTEILKIWKDAVGEKGRNYLFFPLLIKFIDAQSNLSVQVHPDNDYALKNENQFGKAEMWYIVDADEGSGIYCGFKNKISPEEFKCGIESGEIENMLQFMPLKKGQAVFIPPKTVHAIGKGMTIVEIQQNSNLTYRIYDYKRKDKDGNERELHVDKAIAVSDLEPLPKECISSGEVITDISGNHFSTVFANNYFTVELFEIVNEKEVYINNESFYAFTFIEGEGTLRTKNSTENFIKGDTFFLPAGLGYITITGKCKLLLSSL